MASRRLVLIVVGILVAAAALIFAVIGWNRLPAAASAVSALTAIVGVGVTAWAALGGSRPPHAAARSVEVRDSGAIRGTSTAAVSGVAIMGGPPPEQSTVERSGDIDGGTTGVTGYQQSD
jgi:hypothetical protein